MDFFGAIVTNGSVNLGGGSDSFTRVQYGPGCTATNTGGSTSIQDEVQESDDITSWPVLPRHFPRSTPRVHTNLQRSGTWLFPTMVTRFPRRASDCYPGGTILLTGSDYAGYTFECGSISPNGGGVALEAYDYPTNKLLFYEPTRAPR